MIMTQILPLESYGLCFLTLLSRFVFTNTEKDGYDKEHMNFILDPRDLVLTLTTCFSFVLSMKHTTKTLIRLCRCTGWSVSLLDANA